MKWNGFEIKSTNVCGEYELVRRYDSFDITLAFFNYDDNRKDFNINSVGTRLMQYWIVHLDEFILRCLELLKLQYEYD